MEHTSHHNFNFHNKVRRINGTETIFSGYQNRAFTKIRLLSGKNQTCIPCPDDRKYDFTNPGTGLKQSNPGNSIGFSPSENLKLKFDDTNQLTHSIFNRLFCTDSYFHDKKIFEYYLTRNINKIPCHALDTGTRILNSQPRIEMKNTQKDTHTCDQNSRLGEKLLDKSIGIDIDNYCTEHVSQNIVYEGNTEAENGTIKCEKQIETDVETNKPVLGSGSKLLLKLVTDRLVYADDENWDSVKLNEGEPEDEQNDNFSSIALKSNNKLLSSNYSHAIRNKKNNILQVFCVNGCSKHEFAIPELTKSCISETYISTTELDIGAGCDYYTTCFRSQMKGTSTNFISHSMKTEKSICKIEIPSTNTDCSKQTTTSFGQYLTSSLLNTTSKCQNLEDRSFHENDMSSLSALSLFFIIKDLHSGDKGYCKHSNSNKLLSKAMICLRMTKNSEKKICIPHIQKLTNKKVRSCSDILQHGNGFNQNTTCSEIPVNPMPQFRSCPSRRSVCEQVRNSALKDTVGSNHYQTLGIQATAHNEKRYPKELNLLLSFQADNKRDCHAIDCPYGASKTIQCQSGLKKKNCKFDKIAQASVSHKSACIQLSVIDTPIVQQKSNQVCPSRKSACIQPSYTIALRKSNPTNVPFETNETKYRLCGAATSPDESSHMLLSPPPCALFLPEDAPRELFIDSPQKPVMRSMVTEHYEETGTNISKYAESNKNSCRLSTQKILCNLKSNDNSCLSYKENISRSCSKPQNSNSIKKTCIRKSSTRGILSAKPDISSNTCKDSPKLSFSDTRDSAEELEVLNLKQVSPYSKILKKKELFSSFDFKSVNDFDYKKQNKEDLNLISEDFQNLKQAIEKFMTIDILETTR